MIGAYLRLLCSGVQPVPQLPFSAHFPFPFFSLLAACQPGVVNSRTLESTLNILKPIVFPLRDINNIDTHLRSTVTVIFSGSTTL